jgi:hypothetical protein
VTAQLKTLVLRASKHHPLAEFSEHLGNERAEATWLWLIVVIIDRIERTRVACRVQCRAWGEQG